MKIIELKKLPKELTEMKKMFFWSQLAKRWRCVSVRKIFYSELLDDFMQA